MHKKYISSLASCSPKIRLVTRIQTKFWLPKENQFFQHGQKMEEGICFLYSLESDRKEDLILYYIFSFFTYFPTNQRQEICIVSFFYPPNSDIPHHPPLLSDLEAAGSLINNNPNCLFSEVPKEIKCMLPICKCNSKISVDYSEKKK